MYRICHTMGKATMKTGTIPPLRVPAKLRKEFEAVFVARGLASAARARRNRSYIPAAKVIGALRRKLAAARLRTR